MGSSVSSNIIKPVTNNKRESETCQRPTTHIDIGDARRPEEIRGVIEKHLRELHPGYTIRWENPALRGIEKSSLDIIRCTSMKESATLKEQK